MLKLKDFYKKFLNISQPYSYQEEVWSKFTQGRFPILIRAPTGSGKTEAVLAPFLAQFLNNKFSLAPRLIYVLPMRVLVNSVAERIKRYAQKISPHISVNIQHGDVPNAPFFIADIVVTTLDQFLYGFARVSQQVGHHLDMPAGAIASSIVVFDEAHMYRDEFTFSIMRALMEILHKSAIPFVVMTATMPESLEKSLFENIGLNDASKITGEKVINSELKITIYDQPLYSASRVSIDDRLLEKIKKRKTLIVLNQVQRAQKVYEEIKNRLKLNEDQIVLLHSRFTREDRQQHEQKALSLIPGKDRTQPSSLKGAGVVVSTQVLEAGIDFSAELLLTELAPADCLIQRAGRCARYEGEKGEMIIFPVDDDNGHPPYDKEHLEKTTEWLKQNRQFNIKDFNQVCDFVDILDYQANDYEARDTLIDLYECVLYADSTPANIQLRKGKPVTLVVIEGETQNEIEQEIKRDPDILKKNALEVDIKVACSLSLFQDKNRPIQWEIQWRYNPDNKTTEWKLNKLKELKDNKAPGNEDARIAPFRTYILTQNYYNKEKGIEKDVCAIV